MPLVLAELERSAAGLDTSLEHVTRENRRLGWVLGVLASSTGADLLGDRRDPEGLEQLFVLLGRVLSERGVELVESTASPRVGNHVRSGWELPWALGTAVLLAAGRGAGRVELEWSVGGTECGLSVTSREPLPLSVWDSFRSVLDQRLEGARLAVGERSLHLTLPGDWLEEC